MYSSVLSKFIFDYNTTLVHLSFHHQRPSYGTLIFESITIYVLQIGVISFSHEPPEWPEAARTSHACDSVQTHDCAAAEGGPRRPGPDQGLQQLPPAPL